jgi:hypothetical protein
MKLHITYVPTMTEAASSYRPYTYTTYTDHVNTIIIIIIIIISKDWEFINVQA